MNWLIGCIIGTTLGFIIDRFIILVIKRKREKELISGKWYLRHYE